MIRTFKTHEVRMQEELTGSLWEFEPCEGDYAGTKFQMATPGCFETNPLFANYRGEAYFRKKITAGGNIRIECKGVSHTATVLLDGEQIAQHYNAYTPFSVIKKDLTEGTHLLEIKVDNRFTEKSALHIPNDYMSYGGVSRPVVLEKIGALYFEYVHVKTYHKNGKWTAGVKVAVHILDQKRLAGENVVISLQIGEVIYDWQLLSDKGDRQILSTELIFEDVQEWSPDSPKLYEVKLQAKVGEIVMDDLIDRFGFREIKVQEKKFY